MNEAGEVVVMVRDRLDDIPNDDIPRGYALRPFQAGDAETWLRIHVVADEYGTFSDRTFVAEFGTDEVALGRRQLYAVDRHGEAVGTVTAWFPQRGICSAVGRLHWLAVLPGHQHRGVGSALVTATLRRLRELGYQHAYLTSASVRKEALRLYRALGFRTASRGDVETVSCRSSGGAGA